MYKILADLCQISIYPYFEHCIACIILINVLDGLTGCLSCIFQQKPKSLLPAGPATLLNRSKRSISFFLFSNNSMVTKSKVLQYYFQKFNFDFSHFAIVYNANSSCREGFHYPFCQRSQTVKSLYILMKAILGASLVIQSRMVSQSWIFQFP